MYVDCVDYEVRRREVYRLGVGELVFGVGMLGMLVYWCISVLVYWESEVPESSLVH